MIAGDGDHSVLRYQTQRNECARPLILVANKKNLQKREDGDEHQWKRPALQAVVRPVGDFCQLEVDDLEGGEARVAEEALQVADDGVAVPHEHVVVLLSAEEVLDQHNDGDQRNKQRIDRGDEQDQQVEIRPVPLVHLVHITLCTYCEVGCQGNPYRMHQQKHDDECDDQVEHII